MAIAQLSAIAAPSTGLGGQRSPLTELSPGRFSASGATLQETCIGRPAADLFFEGSSK